MAGRTPKSDVVVDLVADRQNDYFCNQFAFIVTMGQYFGLMPVEKIYKKGRFDVKFKWHSLKVLYSFLNILGNLSLGTFCILEFAIHGFQLDRSGTLIFYIMNLFGSIVFVDISRKWSFLINEWTETEIVMQSYGPVKNLKIRLVITMIAVIFLSCGEHLLFILNDISKAAKCENEDVDNFESYFIIAHPQVFRVVDFSYPKAVIVKLANLLSTITWNFTDAFIILISSALALRFKQVAGRISSTNFLDTDVKFWRQTREDFNRMCLLARVVDKHVSALVTISFMNNTFFICIQLYNSLKEREGMTEKAYFFYSFAYLLVRTASVTLYGAWVNDESRKPLDMLHSVPPNQYNIEVSRFVEQIHTMPIGMTGSNFFIVTRGFLLKIIGTILTCELMILEFGLLLRPGTTQTVFRSQ